jgi:PKD repeat protein
MESVIATPTIVEPPSPQFPEIHLRIQGSFVSGEPILFDASSSTDPNGDILTYFWEFGDGANATDSMVTHAFVTSTTYDVLLTASDGTFRSYATGTIEIKPPSAPPITLVLNEIHPSPSSGPEWIEVTGPALHDIALLNGWTLADKTGTIFRFASTTKNVTMTNTFVVAQLSSSRLNNSGDTVYLLRPDGSTADAIHYGKTENDLSWIRSPNQNASWRVSHTPTPGAVNQMDAAVTATPPIAHVTITAIDHPTLDVKPNVPVGETAELSVEALTASSAPLAKQTPKPTTKSTQKAITTITKPAIKKAVSMKKASLPASSSQPRVTLTGTVATVPGLLAKNQFVLLNDVGRGLLVKGNGKQKTPAYGSKVRVTGELHSNDDGAVLTMKATDAWVALPMGEPPPPRMIDLLASLTEDAWSLAEITGTVRETRTSAIVIDTGDLDLTVTVKPAARYRAVRLTPGDQIRVRGLADLRGEEAKLLIRVPDDVTILKHAPNTKASAPQKSDLPPWTPFGAAGLTVALTHGYRQIKKLREQQRIDRMLKQAAESLQT